MLRWTAMFTLITTCIIGQHHNNFTLMRTCWQMTRWKGAQWSRGNNAQVESQRQVMFVAALDCRPVTTGRSGDSLEPTHVTQSRIYVHVIIKHGLLIKALAIVITKEHINPQNQVLHHRVSAYEFKFFGDSSSLLIYGKGFKWDSNAQMISHTQLCCFEVWR